ncbi:ATP-binding protein [Candidatus Nitrosocosmicus sp. T]
MQDIKPLGITFVSENFSNSIDSFWIIIKPEILINPFDFISVENVQNTKTIGIVKELKRIYLDLESIAKNQYSSLLNLNMNTDEKLGYGLTVAKIEVIANRQFVASGQEEYFSNDSSHSKKPVKSKNLSINMPVQEGKLVTFATIEEVISSLGIPEMEHPIPSGVISMTNDSKIPIDLDVTYVFGPDTTHVNATGISGNMKTSYLLFLLQVLHQKLSDEGISIILFNTKEKDLLYLDKERDEDYTLEDKQVLDLLGLNLTPFSNVKYFLPRGKDGKPNSAHIPDKNYMTYSFELPDVYDRLELLFSSETTLDPQHNISSILNYIYEFWPNLSQGGNDKRNSDKIETWTDLINFTDYPEEIVTHKTTLLKFQGMIQRYRKPFTLFVDKKVTSTYLGKEIKKMKRNEVFVIDIARLSTLDEQAFVVGDVMRTINEMYSVGHVNNHDDDFDGADAEIDHEKENTITNTAKKPKYIVIFIDEVNRFLPRGESGSTGLGVSMSNRSAVAEELLKTLITGKSRHCILFSAQQFKSQIDPSINENTGLHVITKLGLSELSSNSYSMVDDTTKSVISKLHKGEFILVHPAFRHPIKITIPKPTFKRP